MMEDHMLDKCDSLILGYNLSTVMLNELSRVNNQSHIFGINKNDILIENMIISEQQKIKQKNKKPSKRNNKKSNIHILEEATENKEDGEENDEEDEEENVEEGEEEGSVEHDEEGNGEEKSRNINKDSIINEN